MNEDECYCCPCCDECCEGCCSDYADGHCECWEGDEDY